MRMVIGVDWSDEAFAALQLATTLYRPQAVSLVHGVDLGWFQYPIVAEAGNVQGYDEFRQAMEESGRQLLARTAAILPQDISSVTQVCEIAKPETLVLDTAAKLSADLIAVGARGRGRMAEVFLGSVSHRIAMHAPCATLVVKRDSKTVSNVLLAVEEQEDAGRMTAWLRRYPFRRHAAVTVLRVIQPIPDAETFSMVPTGAWEEIAEQHANELVNQTALSLSDSCASITTKVVIGNPVEELAKIAKAYDVLVIGSHVRRGIDRFLLGSVSHTLLHKAPCSVLMVRG
ncbi:MAG: universal stress protein [Nitrospiraceae bacterium]